MSHRSLFCATNRAIELLAEVPIAASLGGIRPIPAHVERRRRRHSSGGHDGAQCDTVKDGPVVGLRDPRPDRPHNRGGFHGHSTAPAHRDVGPTGCDASISNCDVTGSDRDASMSGYDVTSSGDASMPNRTPIDTFKGAAALGTRANTCVVARDLINALHNADRRGKEDFPSRGA
jgi:hypothetical protein